MALARLDAPGHATWRGVGQAFVRAVAMALVVAGAADAARAQPAIPTVLVPIAAAVRSGEHADALRRLDALDATMRASPAVTYLEGRLADALSDPSRAADAYDRARAGDALPAAIRDDAATRRHRALVHAGRCAEADAAWRDVARPAPVDHALRAECALASGRLEIADASLERAAQRDAADVDGFAVRLARAELLARRGRTAEAVTALRRALVERCEHPDAPRAAALLRSLVGAEPTWSDDERRARATRFAEVRQHGHAADELDAIPRPSDPSARQRWLRARGEALFRARRDYAGAARLFSEAAALGGPGAPNDEFMVARALARGGDDAAAIRAYRRIAARGARHPKSGDAAYQAAWLELRAGGTNAGRAMERFLASRAASGRPERAREGRFLLGLHELERGRAAQALSHFATVARTTRDAEERRRDDYWRARALEASGAREAAVAAYRELVTDATLHWYALLAHDRLAGLGAPIASPFASPPRPEETPPAPAVLPDDVAWLLSLGLDRDAADALRRAEAQVRAAAGLRGLVGAFTAVGDATRTFRLVAGHEALSRPALGAERWVWEAAYPRAFAPAVEAAAAAEGLAPSLLWAVMRQESAYDPDALSTADAIGLLQMLPSTGARFAEPLGLAFDRDRLFDPVWNTRLASAYLRLLVDTLGVPLAFAAYNAGEHRVSSWLEASGEVALDLFVERIPYDQTRGYVRRVTSHLAHYLHAARPSDGWPLLTLPATVGPGHRRAAPRGRATSTRGRADHAGQ